MIIAPPPLLNWHRDASPPPLHQGALHLWRINADTPCEELDQQCRQILSPEEFARGQRLRLPVLRQRFLLSHVATRRIFGAYLGCAPETIVFAYSATGKPSIRAPATELEFNLSTSGDLTLLALRQGEPLGIDGEILRERIDPISIAKRMFDKTLVDQLSALQGKERLLVFYRAWTALEARVKRDGRGLPGHRQLDAPDIAVIHARPRADAICAIAGRCLPPCADWMPRDWPG